MKSHGSLDNLRDIYIPPELGFFPLSEGYFALLIFTTSILLTLIYLSVARYKANRYKREALKELKTLNEVSGIFFLIKRVMLTSHPREVVASLSGSALVDVMQILKHSELLLKANSSIYNPSLELDGDEQIQFKKIIKLWIKRQKGLE